MTLTDKGTVSHYQAWNSRADVGLSPIDSQQTNTKQMTLKLAQQTPSHLAFEQISTRNRFIDNNVRQTKVYRKSTY